jgi:hypothetical protein
VSFSNGFHNPQEGTTELTTNNITLDFCGDLERNSSWMVSIIENISAFINSTFSNLQENIPRIYKSCVIDCQTLLIKRNGSGIL